MIMTSKLYKNIKDALERIKIITRKGKTGSVYVTDQYFPAQNNDLIGTKVTVRYKRMASPMHVGETVIYQTRHCVVLRCDTTEPYTFIGWISKSGRVLVGDSRYYDISVLSDAGQQNEFLLVETEDFYKCDDVDGYPGIIIRADQSNSDIVVIAEFINDSVVRFVLADETTPLLKNYEPDPIAYRRTLAMVNQKIKDILNVYEIYKSPF